MICPQCGARLAWDDGALCVSCISKEKAKLLTVCRTCEYWVDDEQCVFDPDWDSAGPGKGGCVAWKARES